MAEATAASNTDHPEERVENNCDDSAIARRGVGPYLRVPPEIRLMISKAILEHGEVQIRPQPDTSRVDRLRVFHNICSGDPACPISAHLLRDTDPNRAPGPNSLPGYQILATCKQAYEDGVVAFYTKNTFYLPPGPVDHSINYFKGLTPQNRTLIRKIGIRFGVEDLVPIITPRTEVALGFDDEYRASWDDDKWNADDCLLSRKLYKIWSEKLEWVREWVTVHEVKLEFPALEMTYDVNLDQLNDSLNNADFFRRASTPWTTYYPYYVDNKGYNFSKTIMTTTLKANVDALGMIRTKIQAEGWVKCREWIIDEQQKRLGLSH